MADVTIQGDSVEVRLSLTDRLLAFHGSFHIPLAHVVNAYVSSFEDLELEEALEGTNFGFYRAAGLFGSAQGLIFVDVAGGADSLVLELRGERIPRIAVQLPDGKDPNALAHEIMRRVPDSGPVE